MVDVDNGNDHSASISFENLKRWKTLRKSTMIIFIVQNFLIGSDASFLYMSLLMYLKTDFKTSNPDFFYSLTIFSTIVPSILFLSPLSTYTDRTRNIRLVFFIINTIVIVGNVLYIFPISPWTVIIARLLTGTGLITRSIMNGEVARSYIATEVSSKISSLGFSYMLGYASGPAINFLLLKIRFSIFSLRLDYLNLPGLLMAVLFSILQICSIFMLADLSKIYDLKNDFMTNEEKQSNSVEENTQLLSDNELEENETKGKWFKIFTNPDILVILFSTCCQNFIVCSFYTWIPMVFIDRLRWSVASLGWVNMSVAILTMLPFIVFLRYRISNHRLYYLATFAQIALIICQVVIAVEYFVRDTPINIVLWIVYCSMNMFIGIADEVFCVVVLAQMVSSEHQIFADGVRLTSYRTAGGVAFLIASHTFKSMFVSSSVFIVLLITTIILLIARKKTLQNPSITLY